MRMRQPSNSLLSSCLGLGLAAALLNAGSAQATDAKAAQVGSASYDPAFQVLAIPVSGPAPHVEVHRLAPHQYAVDLGHCVLQRNEVQGQNTPGLLAGWSLDETPTGQTVRLRLTLNQDTEPRLHFESSGRMLRVTIAGGPGYVPAVRQLAPVALAAHHTQHAVQTAASAVRSNVQFPTAAPVGHRLPVGQLAHGQRSGDHPVTVATHVALPPVRLALVKHSVVQPHVSAVLATAHHTYPLRLASRSLPVSATFASFHSDGQAIAALPTPTGPATLGAAHFDARTGLLVIPVTGEVDPRRLEVVQLNKRWAFLDVPSSHPSFDGVRYEDRADKTFQRWVMAKRPNRETTRLSFALGAAVNFGVKLEDHQILIAVRPPQLQLAHKPAAAPLPIAVAAAPVKPTAALAKPAVVVAKPVAIAAKPAAVLAAAPVAASPKTMLGLPFFDAARFGLAIPFTGEMPVYRVVHQSGDVSVLEVAGTPHATGRLTRSLANNVLVKRWHISRDVAAGTMRVALRFKQPSEVVVAADPARQQLLVIPQPLQAAPAKPTHQATTLASVEVSADGTHLFVPFAGPIPAYVMQHVTDSQAIIDFPSAKVATDAVEFGGNENLQYWLLLQHPGATGASLTLALSRSIGAAVFQDAANHRLIVELGGQPAQASGRLTLPAPWPGEQHAAKAFVPAMKVSRKAS